MTFLIVQRYQPNLNYIVAVYTVKNANVRNFCLFMLMPFTFFISYFPYIGAVFILWLVLMMTFFLMPEGIPREANEGLTAKTQKIASIDNEHLELSCSICPSYRQKRLSCAEAGDYENCMRIKMGDAAYSKATNYCSTEGDALTGPKVSLVNCFYFVMNLEPELQK